MLEPQLQIVPRIAGFKNRGTGTQTVAVCGLCTEQWQSVAGVDTYRHGIQEILEAQA